MPSVQVRGKEKLTKLADVLATHGEGKSIRRRLSKTIRDQSEHITREQRENLAARMPHRGGLAAALSGEGRFSIRTTLAGNSAGVTIVDSWKGHDMRAVERGLIRHPVFGEKRLKLTSGGELKSAWVSQAVPPEQLSKPVIRNQLRLRFAIVRSLDELAAQIARET
jgi:hypothetical protein